MARQIMCSCDSGSIYELRSVANNPITPGTAVADYSNFKEPGLASIKNPAGNNLSVSLVPSNPWARRWWLKFYFMFKHYAGDRTDHSRPVISVWNNYGLQTYFRLVPAEGQDEYSLTIVTARKYSDEPDRIEPCKGHPMVENVWYEVIVSVTHSVGDGYWEIWIDGVDNVYPSSNVECGVLNVGDPRDRCCICGDQSCDEPQILLPGTLLLFCPTCCCCGLVCEMPAFPCRGQGPENVYTFNGCSLGQCPCHNENDACYPRRQTQHGADNFVNKLIFGTEEANLDGFDYWFDDIIFNDEAPYKHDNHAVADRATSRMPFGSRLSLLRLDGAGDASEFGTTGSATNFENVDELPISTADYNSSGTLNAKDLYTLESVSETLS